MRSLRRPARQLRTAIDAMPVETRRAMLDALDRAPILVGAYSAPGGGVCPMLAAHRNGGRTDYAAFARAWDRYAGVGGDGPRRASERELQALRAMLEASIADDSCLAPGALASAIADHRRSQLSRARREEHEVDPYELDPLAPPAADPAYTDSPGLRSISSGTMHAGEVLSR